MRLSQILACAGLVGTLLVTAAASAATEPADSLIKNALLDIERFEKQAQTMTGSNAGSRARRVLRLVNMTRQRLDASKNRSHPSWQEADQQLTALTNRLQELADGGNQSAGGSRPAAAAAAQPSQTRTQSQAQSKSQSAPASATAAAKPAGKQLVSGQRVQVRKLARDIAGARSTIKTDGPSALQDRRNLAQYNKALEKYANALSRYKDFAPDPDIAAAAQQYQTFVADLKAEFERAKQQLAHVGDAQARLAAVDQNLQANQPPGQLLIPFTSEQAQSWVGLLKASGQAAQAAKKEIGMLLPVAYLPSDAKYSPRRVDSLLRFATQMEVKGSEAVKQTGDLLKHQFSFSDKHELKFFRGLDPADANVRANMFLQEGAEANVYERLDKERAMTASYAAFHQAFGKEIPAEVTARLDEIAKLRETYAANRVKLIGESRLPKPASTDPERLAIAKKILENPSYGFGEHGPIVLTSEKIITREKEVSRDTIKDADLSLSGTLTLTGTRETWHYKWDEFNFAAPLKNDDGQWYIWWITAKKYESGWERTPIGRWVSGAATQGSLILEKNF